MDRELVLAWLAAARRDQAAGQHLVGQGMPVQAMQMAFQATGKAFKAMFLAGGLPEGTGARPPELLERLMTVENATARAMVARGPAIRRLMAWYTEFDAILAGVRFPRRINGRLLEPDREVRPIEAIQAVTRALEAIGFCERILTESTVGGSCAVAAPPPPLAAGTRPGRGDSLAGSAVGSRGIVGLESEAPSTRGPGS